MCSDQPHWACSSPGPWGLSRAGEGGRVEGAKTGAGGNSLPSSCPGGALAPGATTASRTRLAGGQGALGGGLWGHAWLRGMLVPMPDSGSPTRALTTHHSHSASPAPCAYRSTFPHMCRIRPWERALAWACRGFRAQERTPPAPPSCSCSSVVPAPRPPRSWGRAWALGAAGNHAKGGGCVAGVRPRGGGAAAVVAGTRGSEGAVGLGAGRMLPAPRGPAGTCKASESGQVQHGGGAHRGCWKMQSFCASVSPQHKGEPRSPRAKTSMGHGSTTEPVTFWLPPRDPTGGGACPREAGDPQPGEGLGQGWPRSRGRGAVITACAGPGGGQAGAHLTAQPRRSPSRSAAFFSPSEGKPLQAPALPHPGPWGRRGRAAEAGPGGVLFWGGRPRATAVPPPTKHRPPAAPLHAEHWWRGVGRCRWRARHRGSWDAHTADLYPHASVSPYGVGSSVLTAGPYPCASVSPRHCEQQHPHGRPIPPVPQFLHTLRVMIPPQQARTSVPQFPPNTVGSATLIAGLRPPCLSFPHMLWTAILS